MKYKCGDCGVEGVKLWREYQTFLDHQVLRCADCAVKNQAQPGVSSTITAKTKVGEDGKHEGRYGDRSDQIGWLVPAVPTEDGSFWGYTSVPQSGIEWWEALPTRVGKALAQSEDDR